MGSLMMAVCQVRQADLCLMAARTVNSSYWARLYYQGLREKGKFHQSAIRVLAFKWIRIIYRCWKTRTRYDEAKYLLALEARKSPLLMP